MKDEDKTREQLIEELIKLRDLIDKLKESEDRWKRDEEKLRQNELVLSNWMKMAHGGSWRWDRGNDYIWLSEETCEIFGIEKSDNLIIPKALMDMVHSEDRGAIVEAMAKVANGSAETYDLTFSILRQDGEVRWIEAISPKIAAFTEDGRPKTLVGTIQDITERKRVEEELKESELKFRTLSEQSLVGIAIIQGDRIAYVNQAICDITGIPINEFSNGDIVSLSEIVHPDDRDYVVGQLRKKFSGDVDVAPQYKYRIQKNGGDVKWVEQYSKAINFGGSIAVFATMIDITERMKVEEALRESGEMFRAITENTVLITSIVDGDGAYKYISPAINKIAGYNHDEIVGKKPEDFFHPDDLLESEKTILKAIENPGESIPMSIMRGRKKDGSWIYLEGFVTNLLDVKGVNGIVFNARDITEKMQAENELEESRKNLKALFDSVDDFFLIVDLDGNIIQTNPAVESHLGFSREELTKMSILQIHSPDRRKEVKEIFADIVNGKRDSCNIPVITKDGSTVPVETKITLGKWSGKDVTFGITRDITERLQGEEALRESEEKLRNFFENSKDVIFLSTANNGFIDVNPAAEKFFGYTKDELLEMDISDIYANGKIREIGLNLLDERSSLQDMEVEYKRKDGTIVNGLITATLRKDKDGNIVGYQGIIRDITDRKKTEAQLLAARKMEAIGSLAEGMAHNFNNILVGIMGYSEYLLSKKSEDDPDYKALNTIHGASLKASGLTRQLLNMTKGGKSKPVNMCLNDVVKTILSIITETFDKSIEIKTYLSDDLSEVMGDFIHLEQCLLNLCINARDAMPDGGRITIETFNQRLDEDFVKAHLGAQVGDYVVMSVTDTGKGISSEIKEHIFEPFFTTKGDEVGTGMGLSTVYGIVNSHGGLVAVYSKPGEGSTFKLYFPVLQCD